MPDQDELPICLPCWRTQFSMTEDPPRKPGWPEETCSTCGRRTNYGIYVGEWAGALGVMAGRASVDLTKARKLA